MSVSPWIPPRVPFENGEASFPTRNVYCVGRNYAAHAVEMGSDPRVEPPCFFMKPTDSLLPGGGDVPYPPATANLHHEVELVVAVDRLLVEAAPDEARQAVCGYAVGLDLTRRDLQARAKEKRWPWALAKGFPSAAPLSPLSRSLPDDPEIWLEVNGERRQQARISQLIWSVPEVLAELSRLVPLNPGDLVFTGTPSGVGPLEPGDHLLAHVDGVPELRVHIV